MPYIVNHRYSSAKDWLSVNENGEAFWGSYEEKTKFKNYFKAKAALDSMPIETDSYNYPIQHYFMKVS